MLKQSPFSACDTSVCVLDEAPHNSTHAYTSMRVCVRVCVCVCVCLGVYTPGPFCCRGAVHA